MNRIQRWMAIAGALVGLWSGLPAAIAAPPRTPILLASSDDEWGIPSGNRTGGGQRSGNCPTVRLPLTAIAPVQNQNGARVVQGATAADRPVLWFYLPYAIGDALSAELTVEEPEPGSVQSGRIYYIQRRVLVLPATEPGLVSIRLPATEPPLVVGKTYRWQLAVYCDPEDATGIKVAEVSLVRVSPTRSLPTPTTTNAELDFYTQERLWSEFITTLATLHCESSPDPQIQTRWNTVMQKIDLAAIANQPNLTCSAR